MKSKMSNCTLAASGLWRRCPAAGPGEAACREQWSPGGGAVRDLEGRRSFGESSLPCSFEHEVRQAEAHKATLQMLSSSLEVPGKRICDLSCACNAFGLCGNRTRAGTTASQNCGQRWSCREVLAGMPMVAQRVPSFESFVRRSRRCGEASCRKAGCGRMGVSNDQGP